MLDRRQSDAGVQSVEAGGFPAALDTACGEWFAASPGLPVVMAGMVGSRNGWVEAPYVACPCGPAEIAARLIPVPGSGREVGIVPGVDCRWADGSYDVMRGEETQAIGTGVRRGLLSLPGTHGKWIEMVDGRIARFATFVTGELFAAVSTSFVARLAEAPDDPEAGQPIAREGPTCRVSSSRPRSRERSTCSAEPPWCTSSRVSRSSASIVRPSRNGASTWWSMSRPPRRWPG